MHLSVQGTPFSKHSQYFFWHWLFLQRHPLKCSVWSFWTFSSKAWGFLCKISSIASRLTSEWISLFRHFSQSQLHSGPHMALFLMHSQYSLRHPVFLHLHPLVTYPAALAAVKYSFWVDVSLTIYSALSLMFSLFSLFCRSFSWVDSFEAVFFFIIFGVFWGPCFDTELSFTAELLSNRG